jgi:hypothetical protein
MPSKKSNNPNRRRLLISKKLVTKPERPKKIALKQKS